MHFWGGWDPVQKRRLFCDTQSYSLCYSDQEHCFRHKAPPESGPGVVEGQHQRAPAAARAGGAQEGRGGGGGGGGRSSFGRGGPVGAQQEAHQEGQPGDVREGL